jgi:hypothetical protein
MGTACFNFRVDLLPFRFCKLPERVYNSVRNCPPKKVQLGTRGCQTLKVDTLRPTKRIKELFTVPVQTGLVCYVYRKNLAVRRRERHVVRLGIVGHKPLELPERRAFSVTENVMELFAILGNFEKLGKT